MKELDGRRMHAHLMTMLKLQASTYSEKSTNLSVYEYNIQALCMKQNFVKLWVVKVWNSNITSWVTTSVMTFGRTKYCLLNNTGRDAWNSKRPADKTMVTANMLAMRMARELIWAEINMTVLLLLAVLEQKAAAVWATRMKKKRQEATVRPARISPIHLGYRLAYCTSLWMGNAIRVYLRA